MFFANQKNNIQRNSWFEIVRIFCIFGIIVSHYSVHGCKNIITNDFTTNNVILDLSQIGSICVSIFVMMSGFFLNKSFRFNSIKFLKLVLETSFYCLLGFVVLSIIEHTFSFSNFYLALFGLFTQQNWFIGCYLIIYCFHPFINKALHALTKRELNIFCLILFIITTIITTFPKVSLFVNELVSLFSVYCFGAYISINNDSRFFKTKSLIFVLISCILFLPASAIIIRFAGTKMTFFAGQSTYFYGRNSIPTILFSASLILLIQKIKPIESKIINYIAASSLGIYLLHDNYFFKEYMWQAIFKTEIYAARNTMIIHLFCTCLIIFISCLAIDIVRRLLLETPFFILVKKVDLSFDYSVSD